MNPSYAYLKHSVMYSFSFLKLPIQQHVPITKPEAKK